MNTPPSAEERLKVSRALCQQALQQPAWLLLAQRVCAQPGQGPHATPANDWMAELWGHGLTALLKHLNDNAAPPQPPTPPPA